MNSNNNASAMKDIGRGASGAMQSTPTVGYSPSSHQGDGAAPAVQSPLYLPAYNQPTYDGLPPSGSYNILPSQPSSFGGVDHSSSPVFRSSVLRSDSHHQHPNNIRIPHHPTSGLLNYRQPPGVPQSPNFLGSYPGALPMPLHANSATSDRYVLPARRMFPRFPGLHPGSSAPSLTGYRPTGDSPVRVPFSSTLLGGNSDHKTLGVPGSPLTPPNNGSSELEARDMNTSRKKRKACGHCPPCQRKDNCGSCMNCVNRVKGKQICIHRKCEVLKKKPGSSSYTPPADGGPERRKEIDDFHAIDIKRSKTSDSPPTNQPPGIGHPTLHPSFPKFGDVNRSSSQHPARIPPGSAGSSAGSLSNATPSFFDQPNPTPQHYSQDTSSKQSVAQDAGNPPTNPAEESEFINEALQVIESSIADPIVDEAVSNRNTFDDALRPDLDQSSSNLLLFQNSKLQEPSFDWNVPAGDRSFLSLGLDSEIPRRPPPITPVPTGEDRAEEADPVASVDSQAAFQVLPSATNNSSTQPSGCSGLNSSSHDHHHNLHQLDSLQPSGVRLKEQSYRTAATSYPGPFPDNPTDSTPMYREAPYAGPVAPAFPGSAPQPTSYDRRNTGYPTSADPQPAPHLDSFGRPMHATAAGYSSPSGSDPRMTHHPSGSGPRMTHHPDNLVIRDFTGKNSMPNDVTAYGYQQIDLQTGNFAQQFNAPQSLQYRQFNTERSITRFNPPTSTSQPTNQRSSTQQEQHMLHSSHIPGWEYQPSSQLVTHNPVGSAAPPNIVGQPGMQHRPNLQHRRISNTPGDAFYTPQPPTNGGNIQSSMMQSSPVAGVVSHSPYAGSAGGGLQSPISAMVGSPVGQVQSVSGASPGINASHPSPLPTAPSTMLAVEAYQRNMQTHHRTGPIQTINYLAHVSHTVAPPIVQQNQPTANHFLAQPGSSISFTQLLQSSPHSAPHRAGRRGGRETAASLAAARLISNQQSASDQDSSSGISRTAKSVLKGHAPPVDIVDKPAGSYFTDGTGSLNLGAVESPNDATPTISPGESGYDSTDIAITDASLLRATPSGHVPTPSVEQEQAKNLQAALMGDVTRYTSDAGEDWSSSLTDSPSRCVPPVKAAPFQVIKNLNTSTVSNHLPHHDTDNATTVAKCTVTSLRSVVTSCSLGRRASFGSAYPEYVDYNDIIMDVGEPSARTTHLRRYSCQGFGASENIRVKKEPKPPQPFHDAAKVTVSVGVRENISALKPNIKVEVLQGPGDDLHGKGSMPSQTGYPYPATTFDSPPQTPLICHKYPPIQSSPETNPFVRSRSADSGKDHFGVSPHQLGLERSDFTLSSEELRGRTIMHKENGDLKEKTVFPQCNCLPGEGRKCENKNDPPYYTHLGAAADVKGIRRIFEERTGCTGAALRIEKVYHTSKEGKTHWGCPIAKWVLRRSSVDEKVMVVCRHRPGHRCLTAYVAMVIVLWEGLDGGVADSTYDKCVELVAKHGKVTPRGCETNGERKCACQGFDENTKGASFSFGCSWCAYNKACKFARSINPKRFKLPKTNDLAIASEWEGVCQRVATLVAGLYKMAAPDAFLNQVEHQQESLECRLGLDSGDVGRPFTGVTCCMDFCAHAHTDTHNVDNGTTVVVTLTKPDNRKVGVKPADEQLHVLPMYRWDHSNEEGTLDGIGEKVNNGAVEILSRFAREVRLYAESQGTCKERQGRANRASIDNGGNPPKRGRKSNKSAEDPVATKPQANVASNHPVVSEDWNPQKLESPQDPTFHLHQLTSPRWPYRSDPPNLPPINNFFTPGSASTMGLTPPTTPSNTPSTHTQAFLFGRRSSASSAPHSSSTNGLSGTHQGIPLPHLNSISRATPNLNSEFTPLPMSPCPPTSFQRTLKMYARGEAPPVKQDTFPSISTPHHSVESEPEIPVTKYNFISDSRESFVDSTVGGVAIAPGHGSILIECAKRERHATTPLLKPDRFNPSRISLVFYQHKRLNHPRHGYDVYAKRRKEEAEAKRKRQEAEVTSVPTVEGSGFEVPASNCAPPHPGYPFKYANGQHSMGERPGGPCPPVAWGNQYHYRLFPSNHQSVSGSHVIIPNFKEVSSAMGPGIVHTFHSRAPILSSSGSAYAVRQPNLLGPVENIPPHTQQTNAPCGHSQVNINMGSSIQPPNMGFMGYRGSSIHSPYLPHLYSGVAIPHNTIVPASSTPPMMPGHGYPLNKHPG